MPSLAVEGKRVRRVPAAYDVSLASRTAVTSSPLQVFDADGQEMLDLVEAYLDPRLRGVEGKWRDRWVKIRESATHLAYAATVQGDMSTSHAILLYRTEPSRKVNNILLRHTREHLRGGGTQRRLDDHILQYLAEGGTQMIDSPACFNTKELVLFYLKLGYFCDQNIWTCRLYSEGQTVQAKNVRLTFFRQRTDETGQRAHTSHSAHAERVIAHHRLEDAGGDDEEHEEKRQRDNLRRARAQLAEDYEANLRLADQQEAELERRIAYKKDHLRALHAQIHQLDEPLQAHRVSQRVPSVPQRLGHGDGWGGRRTFSGIADASREWSSGSPVVERTVAPTETQSQPRGILKSAASTSSSGASATTPHTVRAPEETAPPEFPRPRGRAPHDEDGRRKTWCVETGQWLIVGSDYGSLAQRVRYVDEYDKEMTASKVLLRIKETLQCHICMQDVVEPTLLTTCGHTFCAGCIESLTSRMCPVCRTPVTSLRDRRPNWSLMKIVEAMHE